MAIANMKTANMKAFLVAPAVGFALLPKLACPACWPLYTWLLTATGLGFLISGPYLPALTAVFLAAAACSLGIGAKEYKGHCPLGFGVIAAAAIMFGKFYLESDAWLYAGIALLIAASGWNSFYRRSENKPSCSACAPEQGVK